MDSLPSVFWQSVSHFSAQRRSSLISSPSTNQPSWPSMDTNTNSNKHQTPFSQERPSLMPSHFSTMPLLTRKDKTSAKPQRVSMKRRTSQSQRPTTGEQSTQNVSSQFSTLEMSITVPHHMLIQQSAHLKIESA